MRLEVDILSNSRLVLPGDKSLLAEEDLRPKEDGTLTAGQYRAVVANLTVVNSSLALACTNYTRHVGSLVNVTRLMKSYSLAV